MGLEPSAESGHGGPGWAGPGGTDLPDPKGAVSEPLEPLGTSDRLGLLCVGNEGSQT